MSKDGCKACAMKRTLESGYQWMEKSDGMSYHAKSDCRDIVEVWRWKERKMTSLEIYSFLHLVDEQKVGGGCTMARIMHVCTSFTRSIHLYLTVT